MHVLFVTLDQFRADCLSAAGHPNVQTPHLDRIAARGTRFARHYAQAAPCAPGRASLYTGMYQMNHRVVGNGAPLEDRFDNVARLARRAGYDPALFGYTDQAVDPSLVTGADDERLDTYEGILPGFTAVLHQDGHFEAWRAHLEARGYGTLTPYEALTTECDRPAEESASAFLTDHLLAWLDRQDGPWFAHASYLRPHPPYVAAGEFASAYDPADMVAPIEIGEILHPLHQVALSIPAVAAPTDPRAMAELQAQYLGMVAEVDAEMGRILDRLEALGQLDETVIIVTADHGEQLGDHGLLQKLGFFEESYRILCLVAAPGFPGGQVCDLVTEAVDLVPTVAELLGQEVPVQCDGHSLVKLLAGERPEGWRTSAHYEWDWRDLLLGPASRDPWDPNLYRQNLAVLRTEDAAYVQFGDGSALCFDLAADPTWHTTCDDPAVILPLAQEMLTWRAEHLGGIYTQMILGEQRKGRWPEALLDVV